MSPYMTLDGWTVSTKPGGGLVPQSPSLRRSANRSLIGDRIESSRVWRHTTTVLRQLDALALKGILLGDGQYWAYDSVLNSSKGLDEGTTLAPILFGIGADDARVIDVNKKTESKFGAGSIHGSPAVTNILSANMRDCEDGTAGFTATGGSAIAQDAVNFIQGTKSIECISGGAGGGVETDLVTASAATQYTAAVYVKVATADTITIELLDDVATIDSDDFVFSAAEVGKWWRIELTGTTAGGAANIQVRVEAGAATTFYVDALQIETGNITHAWADATIALAKLGYSATFLKTFTDYTIAMWLKAPAATIAETMRAVDIQLSNGDFILLQRASAVNTMRLRVQIAGVNTDIDKTTAFDGDWHHLAAVFRLNAEADEFNLQLYWDGVSVGTSALTLPDLTKASTFNVCSDKNGNSRWDPYVSGPVELDGLRIVPFAAPTALVVAWSARTAAAGAIPVIQLGGDVIAETELAVQGLVTSDDNVPHYNDSAAVWKNNSSEIDFELHSQDAAPT